MISPGQDVLLRTVERFKEILPVVGDLHALAWLRNDSTAATTTLVDVVTHVSGAELTAVDPPVPSRLVLEGRNGSRLAAKNLHNQGELVVP